MTDSITIGRLAQAAAVNVETIRYYQRRGLVSEPFKPLGGYRRYRPEAVKRVRFIKRAQNLGFTLDEVRGLLALDDGQSCRDTRRLAEKKLAVIEARLADLARMRKLLKGLIAECESGGVWQIDSGNGYWGGLQFTPHTWFAYGGGPFDGTGPFPYSAADQIAVAERVLGAQGPSAWPNCFRWA